jgi:hypothetical protein
LKTAPFYFQTSKSNLSSTHGGGDVNENIATTDDHEVG